MRIVPTLAVSSLAFLAAASAAEAPRSRTETLSCMVMVETHGSIVKATKMGPKYAFDVSFEIGDQTDDGTDTSFKTASLTSLNITGYPLEILQGQKLIGEGSFHRKFGLQSIFAKTETRNGTDLRMEITAGNKGRAIFELFQVREGAWTRDQILSGACQSQRDFREIQMPGNQTS